MEPLTDLNPRLKEGTMLINIAPIDFESPCDLIRKHEVYMITEINELTGTAIMTNSSGIPIELHRNYINSMYFEII